MNKTLPSFIDTPEIPALQEFLFSLARQAPPPIFLHNDILLAFEKYLVLHQGVMAASRKFLAIDNNGHGPLHSAHRFLLRVQEILHLGDHLIMVYRPRRASCRIYRLDRNSDILLQLSISEFLAIKEKLVKPDLPYNHSTLEIDLAPFYDYGPNLRDPDTIGDGIKHLNFHLSASLAQQPEKWGQTLYEFLKLHQLHGVQLLLDGNIIRNPQELESALEDAVDFLERCDCPDNLPRLHERLKAIGFHEGWGNNGARILETMQLLQDSLEQPNGESLEEFLSRIPMVSKVALISPHGWFGQKNVLGRPDTGGQVVYILDQARALEKHLEQDLKLAGIEIEPKILIITRLIPENEGTTSDQRLEKVEHTKNVEILRVPFKDQNDNILRHWVSRFHIWPYLDRFAIDAEEEIKAELDSGPDLIVGNYSDGNLVAAMLAKKLGVIQCNIAHALEKSKYLFSDLYWEDFEDEYHFSAQFMADMIAMNLTNFIITSTRQEITGSDEAIGQYESYQFFTMPGLMRVTNGINLFHPRFNVIPPGVNNDIFFPYSASERRQPERTATLNSVLFEKEDEDCLGRLTHPDRPPLFSIARLDRIKNLTGLVEAYARNQSLRDRANLVLIASKLNPDLCKDAEETDEINRLHALIDQYDLMGNIRWIGKFMSKEDTGEAYRIMADRRGVFVQPALFEAFGLTIIEAMHSGLPVFATKFGGPQEIIEEGTSGFLINPTNHESMSDKINQFIEKSQADEKHWLTLSQQGLKRAQTNFTWELYCKRLTRLTKVYGFWKFSTSHRAKSRLIQYCHLLYQLFYKIRAKLIQ